jgi:hypothetical protein
MEIVQGINARALAVALRAPTYDELCYRVAGLSLVLERAIRLTDETIGKASKEAHLSDIAIYLLNALRPTLDQGKAFSVGRKPGTAGPIRKAIAKLLAKDVSLSNQQLWKRIDEKPPRGWQAFDNPRLGKYLEGPMMSNGTKRHEMGYGRFCTVCGEERKKNTG